MVSGLKYSRMNNEIFNVRNYCDPVKGIVLMSDKVSPVPVLQTFFCCLIL